MGDQIHSPGSVTFSFERIIHHLTRHHSVRHLHARMIFLHDRIRSESYPFFRIEFHRHDRDNGSGSELVHGIYQRLLRSPPPLHGRTVRQPSCGAEAQEVGK